MTEREQAILWLDSFRKNKEPMTLIPKQLIRLMYSVLKNEGKINPPKEQEAVEPVVDIDTWKCWNCGHTLEHQELLGDNVLFHEQYNYCPGCGKAVKWNV